jgi:tetratricopeptide (TPR) repeat protein
MVKLFMKRIVMVSGLFFLLAVAIIRLYPLSKGERYYKRLQKWYNLVEMGRWEEVKVEERFLDRKDIDSFAKKNELSELQNSLAKVSSKKEKTADDWAEIAMLSYKLGEYQKASEAALKAHEMDPVREDLSQLYFTFHSIQKN